MAEIYPIKEDLEDIQYSELSVYELLEKLPDTFYVFHSVQWIKRYNKRKSIWKENDFLIMNKKLGALVLEVKGGDIECHGTVFHQINTKTKEVSVLDPDKKKDPLSQAIDGVYHYRNLIDEVSPKLSERFPIEAAVWFSSSNIKSMMPKFPLKYKEVGGAVLDNSDFSKGPTVINEVFDFYKNREKTDVSEDEFKKILEIIATDFELIKAPAARKSELDYAFLKLTKEQTCLLDYISEQKNATIQGVAGTGKTLIAKEAARRFGQEGRKVLFLCFNRLLYIDLMHRYPYENVTYYNIHTFISKYGSKADLSDLNDRSSELQKIDWDELDYDDVIIDEAQDFENNEIIYFKDYAELKNGHFFVFYDKNQLLTTEKVPEWIVKSECKLLLSKNCRNTKEIALTSYNVIDIELKSDIMMVSGEQTSIVFSKGNCIPKISNIIKLLTGEQYGYAHSDIVILSLKPEKESVMKDINKISGIPITRERTNSSILFTTSKKFKGLESRVVIITDIDENSFSNENEKRNFYVACSRATHKLILMVNADDSEMKNIANVINSGSHFTPGAVIMMKTQSRILDV